MFGGGRECGVPQSEGGGEDTLGGGCAELGVNLRVDVHLPKQPEEEHPGELA